jgi:hypothetical protein
LFLGENFMYAGDVENGIFNLSLNICLFRFSHSL